MTIYVNGNNVTYFDSFGVEFILQVIEKVIGNKSITANIYRIYMNDSVMCTYSCSGFIDFMLKGRSLLCYTILFSPY